MEEDGKVTEEEVAVALAGLYLKGLIEFNTEGDIVRLTEKGEAYECGTSPPLT